MANINFQEVLSAIDQRARVSGQSYLGVQELIGSDERRSADALESLLLYLDALEQHFLLRSNRLDAAIASEIQGVLSEESLPFEGFVIESDERLGLAFGLPNREQLEGDPAAEEALRHIAQIREAIDSGGLS